MTTAHQPTDLDDSDLRAVLEAGLSTGADFSEIYLESRRVRGVQLDDRRVANPVSGRDVGAGVRVVSGLKTGYAYTNVLTRESLLEVAKVAAAGVEGSTITEVADLSAATAAVVHPVQIDPFDADGVDLAAIVRRTEDSARSFDPAVRQATVTYSDTTQDILLANSDGHRHVERRVRTRLVAQVVAARNGDIQTAHEGPGAAVGHELFETHPPEEVGRRVAARAVKLLDAVPPPAGAFPVVLAPGSGGVLFHEACGHGMEADLVARGASVYQGRTGDRIGTPAVSVVDDATLQGHWGSFSFDDEGTPARRTVLFERGVCTDYLSDRLRARQLGIPRSGNARRQSYAHPPIPRMTNTFIVPGPDEPDAIVADVDYGIYCDMLGGGQVEPVSGDFVFGVSLGHLIEKGELTRPVRGANLVGDGPSVLATIDAVASNFDVRQGVCGKDGQHVPAGLGNPTLRIGRITVGGQSR